MRTSRVIQLLALTLCLTLAVPGAALAASFGEFAGGVKTLTGAAKDVKDMNSEEKQETKKSAPATKKQAKPKQESQAAPQKQSAPKKEQRVRGG